MSWTDMSKIAVGAVASAALVGGTYLGTSYLNPKSPSAGVSVDEAKIAEKTADFLAKKLPKDPSALSKDDFAAITEAAKKGSLGEAEIRALLDATLKGKTSVDEKTFNNLVTVAAKAQELQRQAEDKLKDEEAKRGAVIKKAVDEALNEVATKRIDAKMEEAEQRAREALTNSYEVQERILDEAKIELFAKLGPEAAAKAFNEMSTKLLEWRDVRDKAIIDDMKRLRQELQRQEKARANFKVRGK